MTFVHDANRRQGPPPTSLPAAQPSAQPGTRTSPRRRPASPAPASPAPAGSDEDERLRILMVAFRDGGTAGCTTLFTACRPVIVRTARSVGVHPDWIDDVVQDTQMTLLHSSRSYDPSRSFLAWLHTLSKRRAIDAMRRHRRHSRREVHAPLECRRCADPAADASRGWLAAAHARQVADALGTLTLRQRQAVELIALRGLSLAQASLISGRSKGALKVAFHRALAELQARPAAHGSTAEGEPPPASLATP